MAEQLLLPVELRVDARFENYIGNTQLVSALQNPQERFIYFYGETGSGRTHLLQAVCQTYPSTVYIPCKDHALLSPVLFTDLEKLAVIAIDDIECLAGNAAWEEALFHLFNRVKANHARLIMAGAKPVCDLALQLPDLISRLSSMLIFAVSSLDDEAKRQALSLRAKEQGVSLSPAVLQFLLRHFSRRMPDLFTLLSRLERASLQEKRKITIPFVKMILEKEHHDNDHSNTRT